MSLLRHGRISSASLLLQTALALVLLAALWSPLSAAAQHRGGGFVGGMPHGGRMSEGGGRGDFGHPAPDVRRNGPSGMHAGLQLGPPERWWDDKHFVKQLRLSQDQQHRMDAIFEQNRGTLIKRYETLQQEEQRMDGLAHAKQLDEGALFAQIDRIEQARADLGKATTHYLIQLRNELDQDQISKLEDEH